MNEDRMTDVSRVPALAEVAQRYRNLFMEFRCGEPAAQRAPVPGDIKRRTMDIKGLAYFLDAAHVGVCRMADGGQVAVVIAVAHERGIDSKSGGGRSLHPLASRWLLGAKTDIADMRAAEIVVSGGGIHPANLDFRQPPTQPGIAEVDLGELALGCGIVTAVAGVIESPFLGSRISLAAVVTDYALQTDQPLDSRQAKAKDWRYQWGVRWRSVRS